MKKDIMKNIETPLKRFYRENGSLLIKSNLKKEWIEFINTSDYNTTDVEYTYICLELLKRDSLSYKDLHDYLYQIKPSNSRLNIDFSILQAARFSVFGKELLDEMKSIFGDVISKEGLNAAIKELEPKNKRRR
ncbi:MAG: hypothetical protein PUC23_00110 [bacterium]|nr:hypothetical protein [bacterium]